MALGNTAGRELEVSTVGVTESLSCIMTLTLTEDIVNGGKSLLTRQFQRSRA